MIFSMILNPGLTELMIVITVGRCDFILFSTFYTTYSSKDFKLEQPIQQDLMCD